MQVFDRPQVTSNSAPTAIGGPTVRRITPDEFIWLAENGFFQQDERVELVDGRLIAMMAPGPDHHWAIIELNKRLVVQLGDSWWVSPQNGARLFDDITLPNFTILRVDASRSVLPSARDIALVIEVSDTSLAYDRGAKKQIYATAEIPEYWVWDLVHRWVEVYREPANGDYGRLQTYRPGESLNSLAVAGLVIDIAEVFRGLSRPSSRSTKKQS